MRGASVNDPDDLASAQAPPDSVAPTRQASAGGASPRRRGDAPAGRPSGRTPRRRISELLEGGPPADAPRTSRVGRSAGGPAGPRAGSSGERQSWWGWLLLIAIVVTLLLAKWTLLVAIIGLAFLITVHELGHFLLAKKLGMRVERFYIGFPPAIWRHKRGETEYGIGMVPLGGFCKISGMSEEEELPPDALPRAYYNQPVWKRNLAIVAGPLMNVVTAVAILFVFLLAQGTVTPTLTLGEVVPGSPGARAGLQPGDTLMAGRVAGDGSSGVSAWKRFRTWDDASAFLAAHPDTTVELRYRPAAQSGGASSEEAHGADSSEATAGDDASEAVGDGPVRTVLVRLGRNPADESAGYLGVRAGQARDRPAPWTAAWLAVKGSGEIIVRTFQGFWMLLSGQVDATGPNGAAGPIGIVDVSSRAVQQGFYPILLALLSVNLAIINLIPILPFDGGHILLNIIESIRGRKVSPRVMERFATIGVVLVLALFLFLTLGDVRRLLG